MLNKQLQLPYSGVAVSAPASHTVDLNSIPMLDRAIDLEHNIQRSLIWRSAISVMWRVKCDDQCSRSQWPEHIKLLLAPQ